MRFGTDGVRGVAGVDLTPTFATALAAAAVQELTSGPGTDRPLVAVGRDPRPSGEMLQAAVVAGLLGAGADVALLGVVPTPAVARAVADGAPGVLGRPEFGVVISASHNPMPDNGIKLFGRGGGKLSTEAERRIEAAVETGAVGWASGVSVGRVRADLSDDNSWYAEALLATLPHRLDGLRIVVDCANGAASGIAKSLYETAGADVEIINASLDGEHINDRCGATHLSALCDAVSRRSAVLGIAHDGDADRCLAVDGSGAVVDGDAILAVLGLAMQARGRLRGDAVAATVMSNLGLHRAFAASGIGVAVTDVGDRHVLERMHADGLSLGGEQSGHVVLLDHATTGDGLLTALHLLAEVAASGRTLAELASVVQRFPQVLINVKVADRDAAMATIAPLADAATAELGNDGRVLVRPSGTEPLVRVMVEAATEAAASEIAERLADAIR